MYELLGIDIKTSEDSEFQFCQTGLICKVSKSKCMDHCNGFPKNSKGEVPLGK